MGTSSAVNYACLYVGLLEVWRLLPHYKNNLLFSNDSLMTALESGLTLPMSP
jgi:hypothetical protein